MSQTARKFRPPTTITLPWPPTVNGYWRNIKGRTLISRAGRAYRKLIGGLCLEQGVSGARLSGNLAVRLMALPPDRRRRDLDNLFKVTLDSLTHAAVWDDDNQVVSLLAIKVPLEACEVRGEMQIEIRQVRWIGGCWMEYFE